MTGLTPTITLPVTEYEAALAQARADGMRAAAEICMNEARFREAQILDGGDHLNRDQKIRWEAGKIGATVLADRILNETAHNITFRAFMDNFQAAVSKALGVPAALAPAPAVPADAPFPKPTWNPDSSPCGECHLPIGETCDICGASHAPEVVTNTADAGLEALVEAGNRLLPYLAWTIGPESPGHHPTMPSAVAHFSAALTAAQPYVEGV